MKLPEGKWKIPTIVGIVILSIIFFPIAIGLAFMWLANSRISQPALRTISLVVIGFFTVIFGISYVMAMVSPSTTTESNETQETQIVETEQEEIKKEVDEEPKEETKKENTKDKPKEENQEENTEETLGETTNKQPTNTSNTPPLPAPKPKPSPTPEPPQNNCDPNYSGACVPIASDVDCAGGSGNGPAYVVGPVTVIGEDIYGLDRDGNGIGCET